MIEHAPQTSGADRFEDIKKFFEDYIKVLEAKRIKLESFRNDPRFSNEEIDRDLEKVAHLKQLFEEKLRRMSPEELKAQENGKITEAIFTHSIINGDMFGEGTEVIIPSQYDDFVRKVDLIVAAGPEDPNIERPDNIRRNIFGLAFDFCSKAEDASKKLGDTLRDSIVRGYSPSVKYGEFPDKGKTRNMWIAKVIIGADGEAVADFADTLVNAIKSNPNVSIKEIARDVLAKHPIKSIVLDEIMSQLIAFRNIAYLCDSSIPIRNQLAEEFKVEISDNPKYRQIGAMYHRAYKLFSEILETQKIDITKMEKSRRGDKISSTIHSMIGHISDPDKKYRPEDFLGRTVQKQ
ncbi:MAG: hypothetical protein WCW03_03135 [Candidatus Paceibacterota bacterium]|jgi:hypothetical protein